MNLLINVVQSPSRYTPNNTHGLPAREHFGDLARFMGAMTERYRGKVQAYEIWNEQNRACENGGDCSTAGGTGGYVADAGFYVDMLHEAYFAIKAADPYAIVVSGAPTSTETNDPNIAISDSTFIRQMLNNGRFRADAIGVHPGGHNNSPDSMWPDNPGPDGWSNSREFYFRRVEDVRDAVVASGRGDMQLWITEFGWATANNTPGYEYGNDISQETQAQWIVRAFEKGRVDYAPWVGAMFLWNLNFSIAWEGEHNNPSHEQASFSVLNPDWTPRPAWHAIQAMPKR
jgi:GH35 family endo-1,4-beta-xylanase